MEWLSIIVAAITAAITLSGVIVGARMSRATELKVQKKELFVTAYAQFVTAALFCAHSQSKQTAKELSVCVAKLFLLSSEETRNKIDLVASLALSRPINTQKLESALDELSLLAKNEIE